MLAEKTWRAEALIRLLLGLLVTYCIGQLLLLPVQRLDINEIERRTLTILISSLFMQGAVIALLPFFLKEQGLSWSDSFGFKRETRGKAIASGLLAGALVIPTAWMLAQAAAHLLEILTFSPETQELVQDFQRSESETTVGSALLRQRIIFGICVLVLAPMGEEFLFRGLLYPAIKRTGYPKVALWLSAILFAALHQNLLSFIPFVVLGLVLASVYEMTGNLLSSIVTHSFFNAANFFYMLYEQPINGFFRKLYE